MALRSLVSELGSAMEYQGKNRRRRFVYETRNSEYHVFDEVCVAIRDKQTGDWVDCHSALRRRIEGGVRVFSNGSAIPTQRPPELGAPMFFHRDDEEYEQVITSKLVCVSRPERDDLKRYAG